jgi:hypothetical protein
MIEFTGYISKVDKFIFKAEVKDKAIAIKLSKRGVLR